jgi:hypothetical protein
MMGREGHTAMQTIDFTVSDPPSFLIGVFFHLLQLQHQQVRETVRLLHGRDPEDPELRRAIAESAVNQVLASFPEPSRGELTARREDFIAMLERRLSPHEPERPRLKPV